MCVSHLFVLVHLEWSNVTGFMVAFYLKFGQTCFVCGSGSWIKKERCRLSCVHHMPLHNLRVSRCESFVTCICFMTLWPRYKKRVKVQFTQITKKSNSLPQLIPTHANSFCWIWRDLDKFCGHFSSCFKLTLSAMFWSIGLARLLWNYDVNSVFLTVYLFMFVMDHSWILVMHHLYLDTKSLFSLASDFGVTAHSIAAKIV